MPDFLNPGLLALGLPIVAVPILIHLINLMRHRRIEWAAMEFLLESQRRNRTWVMLKQLLLLLMRMAAVAAVVLIVAQPRLRDAWAAWLGGTKTHHIVLLDDSYSMSDRFGDTSAFDVGKRFVINLGTQAARRAEPQTFTVLRFSRAGKLSRGRPPDFLEEIVNADLVVALESKLGAMKPSETDAGPDSALAAISQLLGEEERENRIVYLVSDFRSRDWAEAVALQKELSRLNDLGVHVRLIQCVDAMRPNLAITSLKPLPGTRAAGVPLFLDVTVANYGADPARDVALSLEEDGQPRSGEVIEEILPGRSESRRFYVNFPTAGEHRVAARLASDAVEADNAAHAVIDFPLGVPVLIVDGDANAQDGYFLGTALNPGSVRTGIAPQIELPRYLNHNPLDKFQTIYVCNVDRLDQPGVEALENYVRSGGGVAFFVGEQTNSRVYTEQLYRNGEGLFPVPLAQPLDLIVNRLEKAADLDVADHPLFRIFAGERNPFLNDVSILRYFALPESWRAPPDTTVQILARLRNNAPLVVEQKFGDGRVVAFLTSASPTWNNWAQNPSYVVVVQELQAYLSSVRPTQTSREVGTPLEVRLDPARYQPQVRFLPPGESQMGGLTADATPIRGGLEVSFPDTDASGVYRLALNTTDSKVETRLFAFNVPPEEGDLKMLNGEQLADRLRGVRFEYQRAEDFQFDPTAEAGFNLGQAILYFLVVLLIGEQLLAYSISYHPPAARGAA
jgi:hypothetical protein